MRNLFIGSGAAVLVVAVTSVGFGQGSKDKIRFTLSAGKQVNQNKQDLGGPCVSLLDVSTGAYAAETSRSPGYANGSTLLLAPLRCSQFMFSLQSPSAQRVRKPSSSGDEFTLRTFSGYAPETQMPSKSSSDAQQLAKELSNPVASLISVPFQGNFDFGMGAGSGWRFTLNFQPVIPVALSPKWNMISRTILPIIHQGNVAAPGSQNGLGDIVQSFFFSPNKSEPLIWAVGPVVLIPTATNDFLGSEKLGLGPTILGLRQSGGWTYGLLMNHIWSVAGSDSRASVNSTFLQPFLAYTTKDAWTYSINAESTYDWTGNHWAIPVHPGVAKLVRFGKQPVSFSGTMRCWVTSPQGGPGGCGFRIVVTPLFPKN
jgi:hypothetical protein